MVDAKVDTKVDAKYIGLIVLAVFAGSMLVYTWLSLYNRFDLSVMFYAALLIFSFSLMLIKRWKYVLSISFNQVKALKKILNIKKVSSCLPYNWGFAILHNIPYFSIILDNKCLFCEKFFLKQLKSNLMYYYVNNFKWKEF